MNNYKLTVNGAQTFDCTENDLHKIDAIPLNQNEFHVLKDNIPFAVSVLEKDFKNKKYTLKVNSNIYVVDIANSLDILIKEMGFTIGAGKQVNSLKAPMPGLILEICISEGQTVQTNEPIFILEAMKMENTLLSPREGVIKSIKVAQGNAVDKGQLLIEFE